MDKIERHFDPQAKTIEYSEDVVLYATAWCGYCKKTRALLADNNISYFEYDIEKSEEGNRQYKALNATGVPVLVVKGEVIYGYNRSNMLRALKKL